MEKLYPHKIVRGRAMTVMPSWLLYHVIGWSCICTCVLASTGFIKYTDRTLVCDPDRALQTSALGTNLACARKCKEQLVCTGFMLQLESERAGARLGTCLWCAANAVVNISYTPTDPPTVTWIHVLGQLLNPDKDILDISSSLSVGRIVTLQGTVSDPVPDHSEFSVYTKNDWNIAVAISLHFAYHGYNNTILIHTRTDGSWNTEARLPEGYFPFPPGGKIDFAVLATSEGFRVYINGDFVFTVTSTASWVGTIGHVSFKKINDVWITF
ncbi:galectin [Plakobranchus ocellatus]|uniref:Galectin n=1 Tax=Plakobranchus ocellatus TaxID=259542 RepID=A0AAV4C6S9_9GAST|nr:galectin [Plakobranchus ocellatus]